MSDTWDRWLNRMVYGSLHPFSCTCTTCMAQKRQNDDLLEETLKDFWGKYPVTKNFSIAVELPGVPKENVTVKFKGEYLHIAFTDRFGSNRTREYRLDPDVFDHSLITCKYENGLLSITVPLLKTKKTGPQEIPVEIK